MQTGASRVTVIPAYARQSTAGPVGLATKKRVAAYARVSTDNEEQLTSYEAQVDYYTRHIKERDEWTFVEVYTDEGISATSTKRRDGFKRMIQDALSGKIDLILTKSVSRFARNTVDTLTTVRQLKEKGVEVYFEKENIYTLDSKGELLITIMSSLAQEESRSISENVTWGQRKRFADGKVSLPYKQFLGYEKGPDGRPKIIEKEAAVVRQIYKLFLEGRSVSYIANHLSERHIPTPSGKQQWRTSTVESILTNEKYKGDAILQKSFTVDFLTKKHKVNEGEIPQYYVENSHPAIVSSDVFDMVQEEMRKRKQTGSYSSGSNCFAGKIVCGECGGTYGSKVWHSTSKYRRTIWQCNHKFQNEHKCSTPHLYEEDIRRAFVGAYNSLITNKDEILQEYSIILDTLMDTRALDTESGKICGEQVGIAAAIQQLVNENASTAISQEEYERRYDALAVRYDTAEQRLAEIAGQKRERATRREKIALVLKRLSVNSELVTEFDEELWNVVVERVIVRSAGAVIFIMRDGQEVEWKIEYR